jgi:hypothetical protein
MAPLPVLSAPDQTNSFRRVSIAEVGTVRLEVEQPRLEKEIQIRVADFAAHNWQKTNVTCQIFRLGDDRKEWLIGNFTLKQDRPGSDNYSGAFTWANFFTHGEVAKVVYKSNGVKLPISTWYPFYYH